jgi:hypothetical protein
MQVDIELELPITNLDYICFAVDDKERLVIYHQNDTANIFLLDISISGKCNFSHFLG